MANLPDLRSKEQIIGELIDGFLARVKDVNDLNRGSVINQFFNAVGQSNFKAAADVISMIDALSVDRAEGEALQRLAADANVLVSPGTYSSGRVNITDLSFNKISTNIYAGQPAPVAGSTLLYVVDASKLNTNGGSLYIGRGTPNVEGPLSYTTVQPEAGGAYWSITLDTNSPTTKFHNSGEEVIVSQGGNRKINTGTVVKTPSGQALTSISFKTISPATIPDGEVTVTGVPVIANVLGSRGNVPRGSIREAEGLPFTASVFNENAFVTGLPPDDEDTIREKIKAAEQAKSKGTEQSIKAASIGVTSNDDLKQVQSSNIIRNSDLSADLIFDDGSGYEPIFSGVGIEQVIDNAIGGETELQLRQRPVAEARVISIETAPFTIADNAELSVTVQGETTSHFFSSSDFRVPSSATALEVTTSINGNPNINFLAATFDGETKIVLYPRAKNKNEITINRLTTNDANDSFGFQSETQYTLLLYKNDKILFQDGLQAVVSTRLKSSWSTSIAAGDTLLYTVDGTPPIEVTFTKEVFQEFDLTATVNSFTDINIWNSVFNRLMPGVVSSVSGETIFMASARGIDSSASIEILGGTLKDKIFETGVAISSQGRTSDYTLNKQTGQIGLNEPLAPGDKITAGSSFTRANIVTTQIPDGPGSPGNIWMVVDGGIKLLPSGLEGNTITTFSKSGSKVTITATNPNLDPVAFDEVQVGDWCVAWTEQTDAANYPSLNAYEGFWRVEKVERGQIIVDDGNTTRPPGAAETLPTDRIIFVRSEAPVQKLSYSINPLSAFVDEINESIEGINTEIVGSTVRISTITAGDNGQLAIIAADSQGKALGIPVSSINENIASQKGFIVTEDSEAGIPSFSFSELGAYVSDTQFIDSTYDEIGGTRDDFIEILDRYEVSPNLVSLPDSNRGRRYFVKNFDDTLNTLTLEPKDFSVGEGTVLKQGDRYFLRSSYQFDSTDTVTAIVDGDATTKIFGLPVARKITVNNNSTPTLDDFSADDGESSLDLNDAASFAGFNFNDWKLWRKSATILTDGSTYGLRLNAADHGPSGDKIRVGFTYPTDINTDSLALTINNAEMIDIGIVLPVTTPRTPNWDGTTSFTVDVTPSGAKDEVTYTWRTGTEPNFLATFGGANVDVGDLVIIDNSSDFLAENKNIEAKVTNVTATSFSIEIPGGVAVSDNPTVNSASNINKVLTVTTPTPHQIQQGDRIGIWDTEILTGTNAPIDGAYFATVLSPTSFSVNLGTGVPGGEISQATHSGNIVTCTSVNLHNLNPGNVIKVSNFNVGNYDGTAVVLEVISPNVFSYIRPGSSATAINGRFDFQSTNVDNTNNIVSIVKTNQTVTVDTFTLHGLNNGEIIDITGTVLGAYNAATTYGEGDLISYAGDNYESLVNSNTGNQPDVSPASWTVTTKSLNGRYIVTGLNSPVSFSYTHYEATGGATGSSGSVVNRKEYALLARSLGKEAAALAFGQIGTTAQEVVDYLTQEQSGVLEASIETPYNGSEPINTSTEDNDVATGYLSGNATELRTFKASRAIEVKVDSFVKEGSTIFLNAEGAVQYSGKYAVFAQRTDGPDWILTLQSSIFAQDTQIIDLTGDFIGSTIFTALQDGENSIAITSLDALIGDPQFQTKKAWNLIPKSGEELRLVATNVKQLNEFWNRLVVTGLSNVTTIENSEYGRQLQITTNSFGSNGSIQFTGGVANGANVALVGSGSEINGKIGVFSIPYDLRRGITSKSWVKLEQTVRLNKRINLSGTTSIKVETDGIQITGGTGSFQTQRATTQDKTSIFKVEKHGDFVAFINISGQDIGLDAGEVQEGDWVRIINNPSPAYNSLLFYGPGDRALYAGSNWTALIDNTGVLPIPEDDWDIDTEYGVGDTVAFKGKAYIQAGAGPIIGQYPDDPASDWDLVWEKQEWSGGNTGIFKVVRTFGSNAFWIENENFVEELAVLGDPANLAFYSHDSVMPGDTLVISGNVLGTANAGRFVVRDELFGVGYSFPTATRIWTDPLVVNIAPNWLITSTYNNYALVTYNGVTYRSLQSNNTGNQPDVTPAFWVVETNASVTLGDRFNQVNVEEDEPLRLWKRVLTVGPGNGDLANVIVDSPNLVSRMSVSNAAFIEMQGKLGYDTVPFFGIDAYKHFGGLIKELNRVIYGDPASPVEYPGFRAAGTSIGIKAAIIKKIELSLSVRVRTGISFSDIRDSIKAAVAGYVNTLGTGEKVVLSRVVEAASKISGVSSVVVTFPEYDIASDRIDVGAQEKAAILDPTFDVTVAILDT